MVILKEVIKKWWFWVIVGFVLISLITTFAEPVIEPFAYSDTYSIQVGSEKITINNTELTLDAPIREIDGYSYLPLRFVLDWFDSENVQYDEKTEKITFSMKRYRKIDDSIMEKYNLAESVFNTSDMDKEMKKASSPSKPVNTKTKKPPELSKTEFINLCSTYTYEQLARYPDTYKGCKIKMTGEVVQVIENWGNSVDLRVNMTQNEYFWTDTVFVRYTKGTNEQRILEDDIITIYGISEGLTTYKAVLGQSITIPEITAKYMEIGIVK